MPEPIPAVDPDDTLAVLTAMRSWLSDESHWTQGAWWRDAKGLSTLEREDVASTCAGGAAFLAVGRTPLGPLPRIVAVLRDALGSWKIGTINDSPDGYWRVMSALNMAIAKQERMAEQRIPSAAKEM